MGFFSRKPATERKAAKLQVLRKERLRAEGVRKLDDKIAMERGRIREAKYGKYRAVVKRGGKRIFNGAKTVTSNATTASRPRRARRSVRRVEARPKKRALKRKIEIAPDQDFYPQF